MRRLQEEKLDRPVSAAEIEDYFLINRYGKEEQRYKLLLTKTDKDTLIDLLKCKENHETGSKRILENFQFFNDRIFNICYPCFYPFTQVIFLNLVCNNVLHVSINKIEIFNWYYT